jgi:hypothetical protein
VADPEGNPSPSDSPTQPRCRRWNPSDSELNHHHPTAAMAANGLPLNEMIKRIFKILV